MPTFVLGAVAIASVVLSFAFSLAVLVLSHPSQPQRPPEANRDRPATPALETDGDPGSAPETMSRVLGEVERLAALRERGALTEKEFAAQKAKLLAGGAAGTPRLPQRTS
jgi:hypothetical protein